MKISIIIPAYNEEKNIGQCLQSLADQTVSEPFEVIVVNNRSSDDTRGAAELFSDKLNVRVIDEPTPGRGAARATGFKAATGDVLFSTDADSEVPPDWIEKYVEELERHPTAVAVTGPPEINDCGKVRNKIFNLTVPYFLLFNVLYFGNAGLCGFSFAVRADAYRKSGGFSADDDAYEDLALGNRLAPLGKIIWNTSVRVRFSGRRFQRGLLLGWYEYVKTFIDKFVLHRRRVLLRPINEEA